MAIWDKKQWIGLDNQETRERLEAAGYVIAGIDNGYPSFDKEVDYERVQEIASGVSPPSTPAAPRPGPAKNRKGHKR